MSSRTVEKVVQKEDPLGNKLWRSDGQPQMTTIMVEEPLPSAQSQFTQSPQQTPPVPDPTLNPGGHFQENGRGRGRGGGSRGRGRGGRGGNNRYNTNVQNTNVSCSNGNVQRPNPKCTICEGKHNHLMSCKELTKYLPHGSNKRHFHLHYVQHV